MRIVWVAFFGRALTFAVVPATRAIRHVAVIAGDVRIRLIFILRPRDA